MKVLLTASAIADLDSLAQWIARDIPARAVRFLLELRQRCMQLGEHARAYPLVPRYEDQGIHNDRIATI